MKFIQDLIKGFVESRGRRIKDISSYLSGIGATITTVETFNGEIWTFINADQIKIKHFVGTDNDLKHINRRWQLYLIDKTNGCQHDTFLHSFIKNNKKWFFIKLNDFAEETETGLEKIYNIEEYLDSELQHLLKLEEIRFSDNLSTNRTETDFILMSRGLEEISADYLAKAHKAIEKLLEQLPMSVNANGEQVYEFSEAHNLCYERLKEIQETLDFTFRYQRYRLNQKEDEFLATQEK